MGELFSKKTKIAFGMISAACIGILVMKNVFEIQNHKILKRLEKKLNKYSWEYYD